MALMKEFEDITAKMGEPLSDDAMDKAIERMGVLQDKLDAATPGTWTAPESGQRSAVPAGR
jgi:hypothetical protein